MFVFVNNDRRHICRSHCVDHELRRVVIPQNDINTFAAQLGRYRLNTRTTHTDASTDRVDTLVVRFHRNFRTGARIASRRFDFDDFFTDFRYFDTEQFNQHFRFRTGHEQLSTTRFRTHGVQHTTDTVARAEVFTRQHVFTQDHRFSVTRHPFGFDLQRDVVAVYFLHHAGNDFAFLIAELVNHQCALGFAHFLHDNLFRGLGSDTVKGDRFNLIFDVVTHVQTFVFKTCRFQRDLFGRLGHFFNNYPTSECIEVTAFTIDFYANIDLLFVFFLGCCSQCTFQRFENLLTRQ